MHAVRRSVDSVSATLSYIKQEVAMPSFEPGEGAFLKPECLPILVVGWYEDFYAIQHEVYPDEILTSNDGVFYGSTGVEVVSDGDTLVVIE